MKTDPIDTFSLAIIGAGPMATYAMERLAALLPALPSRPPISVRVFEATGSFGDGAVHNAGQPATSLMNRVACQIALGADETNVPREELLAPDLRPTFETWCAAKFALTRDGRFALQPEDVPPRRLHGEALREQFAIYRRLLEEGGIRVLLHAEAVIDVEETKPDGLIVHTPTRRYSADHILFVTGHGLQPAKGSERTIAGAYPLDETLDAVVPGQRLAIDGMGLTAIDVVLHLTEGRGGRFVETGGVLSYRASGREPAKIVPFSPSGYFIHSRPHNDKARNPALDHQGVFLTVEVVERLRQAVGVATGTGHRQIRQLCFERHVMPLVVLEMAYLYYRTLMGSGCADALRLAAAPGWDAYLRDPEACEQAGDALVAPLHDVFADWAVVGGHSPGLRFDWRRILRPLDVSQAVTGASWRQAVVDFMRHDLAASRQGNLANPTKAACDGVWRDLRAVFCAIADDGGLTPASHRQFQATSMRYYNRLSNGAEGGSLRKVLALIEAGLVDISVGPDPRVMQSPDAIRIEGSRTGVVLEADLLVIGRARAFDAATEPGTLYPRLLERGLVRRWVTPGNPSDAFAPGALDLDMEFHPVGSTGAVDPRLTFLGAPAEGARFFQTSAARPGSANYILDIVANWARRLASTIARAP